VQIGRDFVIFAGGVSVLKCQTERDAQITIAVALDLQANPDERWAELRQRLTASDAAPSSNKAPDTATISGVGAAMVTVTPAGSA
jgi:hypothetical protein